MKKGYEAVPNQQLIEERLRHHWTQREVADQIGTTPTNYSRWERGATCPGSYFRSQLCQLFGKSERELGLRQEEVEAPEEERTTALASAPSAGKDVEAPSSTTPDGNKSEGNSAAALPPDAAEKAIAASSATPSSMATAITPVLSTQLAQPTPVPQQSGISRRSVVLGLAGVAVVGIASSGAVVYLPKIFDKASNIITRPTPAGTVAPNQIGQPTLYTYLGHTGFVNGVAWSPDGMRIISGDNDFWVKVWDAANGGHADAYQHALPVRAVAWSPDGRYIASASKDKTVQVRDAVTMKRVYTYTEHRGSVNGVAWSPNSKYIVSGSADKTVRVWDAFTGTTFAMNHHLDIVNTVAWSPNGKYIASGSIDHTVKILDVAAGKSVYVFTRHTNQLKSVAWSPDSTRIVSGSADRTAMVWEAISGHLLYTYQEPAGVVHAVAWSPASGSDLIAIGSAAGHVQVLDATTGAHVSYHEGQTAQINSIAWSPDVTRIVSGSNDKTVQIWRAV
jgi:transcriptional regulator with XRE-family HTH domain/uncharacterized protein with WD repeat